MLVQLVILIYLSTEEEISLLSSVTENVLLIFQAEIFSLVKARAEDQPAINIFVLITLI